VVIEGFQISGKGCLFCNEKESVSHMLFECVVAKSAWEIVCKATGISVGRAYEYVGLCNKKYGTVNMINAAVCWGIWKLRNSLCFQDVA
jgi:hypothetical protein